MGGTSPVLRYGSNAGTNFLQPSPQFDSRRLRLDERGFSPLRWFALRFLASSNGSGLTSPKSADRQAMVGVVTPYLLAALDRQHMSGTDNLDADHAGNKYRSNVSTYSIVISFSVLQFWRIVLMRI